MTKQKLDSSEHMTIAGNLQIVRDTLISLQITFDYTYPRDTKVMRNLGKMLDELESLRCELDNYFYELPEVRKIESPYYSSKGITGVELMAMPLDEGLDNVRATQLALRQLERGRESLCRV